MSPAQNRRQRRVGRLASALGLLVMVVFGTWGCLNAAVQDPDAWRSGLVAIGGALLMVGGMVLSGNLTGFVGKARRILGGVGLVVAPIAALLSLFQLGTNPPDAVGPLIATIVAISLWGQAIALQAGLPLRVAASWIALTIAFVAVALPIAGAIAAAVATAATSFGLDSKGAMAAAFATGATIIAVVIRAWAANRPDRQAVPGAVRRAMFGHAFPDDRALLATGPGMILRRRPPSSAELQASRVRVAALDRRFDPRGAGAQREQDEHNPSED